MEHGFMGGCMIAGIALLETAGLWWNKRDDENMMDVLFTISRLLCIGVAVNAITVFMILIMVLVGDLWYQTNRISVFHYSNANLTSLFIVLTLPFLVLVLFKVWDKHQEKRRLTYNKDWQRHIDALTAGRVAISAITLPCFGSDFIDPLLISALRTYYVTTARVAISKDSSISSKYSTVNTVVVNEEIQFMMVFERMCDYSGRFNFTPALEPSFLKRFMTHAVEKYLEDQIQANAPETKKDQ